MGRAAAWAVHVYTAAGAVLALLMVHFAERGEVRTVLWLFLAAMVVDGTDGMLARRLRVKERVPQIDGALLDNIVDYLTYAFAPMVLLWSTGYLPSGWLGGVVAAVPLAASCYQFTRSDAKGGPGADGAVAVQASVLAAEEEHHFRGFPSYWNVVAFYVVVLELDAAVTTVVLVVLSVLVFVPVRYLYPSRTETLWYTNMALATAFLVLWAAITAQLPGTPTALVALSWAYLAYYVAISVWLTVRPRRVVPAPA